MAEVKSRHDCGYDKETNCPTTNYAHDKCQATIKLLSMHLRHRRCHFWAADAFVFHELSIVLMQRYIHRYLKDFSLINPSRCSNTYVFQPLKTHSSYFLRRFLLDDSGSSVASCNLMRFTSVTSPGAIHLVSFARRPSGTWTASPGQSPTSQEANTSSCFVLLERSKDFLLDLPLSSKLGWF